MGLSKISSWSSREPRQVPLILGPLILTWSCFYLPYWGLQIQRQLNSSNTHDHEHVWSSKDQDSGHKWQSLADSLLAAQSWEQIQAFPQWTYLTLENSSMKLGKICSDEHMSACEKPWIWSLYNTVAPAFQGALPRLHEHCSKYHFPYLDYWAQREYTLTKLSADASLIILQANFSFNNNN